VRKTAAGLSSFVSTHLNNGDIDKAVEAIEKIAKEDRKLPYKFQLMQKLIEVSSAVTIMDTTLQSHKP
jgi:hypothetical protein